MRSLNSILNVRDELNLKSLHDLIVSIPAYFANKKGPREGLVLVLSEMLATENLQAVCSKVNTELKNKTARSIEERGSLALLAAAIQYKLNIKSDSLSKQIETLEKENKKHPSPKTSAKIDEMKEIGNVARKLEGDTIDTRINRFDLNVRMLNNILSQSPCYISNFAHENQQTLSDSLRDFNMHYRELIDAQSSSAEESELSRLYKQCEEDSDALISGICTAIGLKIEEQRTLGSASVHNKMSTQYIAVSSQFGALIKVEGDASVYQEITEKFQKLLDSMLTLIHELPNS